MGLEGSCWLQTDQVVVTKLEVADKSVSEVEAVEDREAHRQSQLILGCGGVYDRGKWGQKIGHRRTFL